MVQARVVAVAEATPEEARRQALIAGGLSAWLAYTLEFNAIRASSIPLPPCPFYLLTGHPCPFCGGTRAFAAMWRLDVTRAAHLYPLSPLLFATTVAAVIAVVLLLGSRRALRVRLPPRAWGVVAAAVGLALVGQWIVKLAWLGNT